MQKLLQFRFADFCRKYAVPALACSWISGLISGNLAGGGVSFDLSALVSAFQNETSISLFAVMLFPIVASVLVMYMGQPWLLFVIAFGKSFSFAYVSRIFLDCFGPAGWLIQLLVMFSDCLNLPILWWLWHRMLLQPRRPSIRLAVSAASITTAISIMDDHFITPILSALQIS